MLHYRSHRAALTPRESTCALPIAPLIAASALLVSLGCATRDIEWDAERRVAGAMLPGSTLVLLEGGVPAVRPAWTPVRWPEDSLACEATRVGARARGDTVYALWWTRTHTGDARLVASRSDDGGLKWQAADTVGRSKAVRSPGESCRRPPAGIGVDTTSGALLAVYHGQAAGHEGVLMARYAAVAGRFTAPTLVAEGATTGMASVASAGDTVAVAFESPSSGDAGVWLAISSVSGHIPDIRLTVSAVGVRAFAPSVAMRDGRVAVAWNEPRRGDIGPAAVARVGRITR